MNYSGATSSRAGGPRSNERDSSGNELAVSVTSTVSAIIDVYYELVTGRFADKPVLAFSQFTEMSSKAFGCKTGIRFSVLNLIFVVLSRPMTDRELVCRRISRKALAL